MLYNADGTGNLGQIFRGARFSQDSYIGEYGNQGTHPMDVYGNRYHTVKRGVVVKKNK
jgi:hypothetical protein